MTTSERASCSSSHNDVDFLRRISVPAQGEGGGAHGRTCALTAAGFRLKTTSGGCRRGTGNTVIGGVQRAAASTI